MNEKRNERPKHIDKINYTTLKPAVSVLFSGHRPPYIDHECKGFCIISLVTIYYRWMVMQEFSFPICTSNLISCQAIKVLVTYDRD